MHREELRSFPFDLGPMMGLRLALPGNSIGASASRRMAMSRLSLLPAAVGLCLFGLSFANAGQPPDRGPTPGLGWGPGGNHDRSMSAPAPVVGVGIPGALMVGGYLWVRYRARKHN